MSTKTYNATIEQSGKTFRIKNVITEETVNQHATRTKQVNARKFSRALNSGEIVIN